MERLDDPASYALDASDMFGHIERLGFELQLAWGEAAGLRLPRRGRPSALLVAGMGGSAAAGDYLVSASRDSAAVPIEVVRDSRLPAYCDETTLVAIVSYSGGTEEAVACYRDALGRRARVLVITRGGHLGDCARRDGVPLHEIAYESPPRAALAHALGPLLRLAQMTGAAPFNDEDIGLAARAHADLVAAQLTTTVPCAENRAKRAAASLLGRIPVVFAAEPLTAAGRRMKNQFAENAKLLGAFERLPEATHNVPVGIEGSDVSRVTAVALDSPYCEVTSRRRAEAAYRQFEAAGAAVMPVQTTGRSILADLLEATAWGDYLSCYAALLRGQDPTPTENLDRIRAATMAPTA